MRNIRKGKGYSWSEDTHGPGGTERTASGFTVDNLDTKNLSEADNNYEKVFIAIRDFLEEQKNGQCNFGSEAARLSLTQGIADLLRQTGLIRKESK